jgi:hypothetical protein
VLKKHHVLAMQTSEKRLDQLFFERAFNRAARLKGAT